MLSPLSIAAFSAGMAPASGVSGNVLPARSVSAPSSRSGAQPAPAGIAPPIRDVPNRVLPRGSLLDLSI
jgi:hypothetical protein